MNLQLRVVLEADQLTVNTDTTGGPTDFRFTKAVDTGATDLSVNDEQLAEAVTRFGNEMASLVTRFRHEVLLVSEVAHDTAFEQAIERAKGDEE